MIEYINMSSEHYTILGAGVVGLTTALALHAAHTQATITVIAQYLPGDRDPTYASPWAGANWQSVANDNGPLETYDRVTFAKFERLAAEHPECGIAQMGIRKYADAPIEESGMQSVGTRRVWYEDLVGLKYLKKSELLPDAVFGVDIEKTWVVNTAIYLPWLMGQCIATRKINLVRRKYNHIDAVFADYPNSEAVFNCTGLGAYSLGGVEDKSMFPVRGQIVLVAEPKTPIDKMYVRTPKKGLDIATYVFPRPLGGGVILGGCRQKGSWNREVDEKLAEEIKERCCALCPELGRPADLQVMSHGVGFRRES